MEIPLIFKDQKIPLFYFVNGANQLRAFTDNRDDLSLGHVVVLLQYDWPQGEMLFLKAVDKICQQGSFQYENFFNYVTSILAKPQIQRTWMQHTTCCRAGRMTTVNLNLVHMLSCLWLFHILTLRSCQILTCWRNLHTCVLQKGGGSSWSCCPIRECWLSKRHAFRRFSIGAVILCSLGLLVQWQWRWRPVGIIGCRPCPHGDALLYTPI